MKETSSLAYCAYVAFPSYFYVQMRIQSQKSSAFSNLSWELITRRYFFLKSKVKLQSISLDFHVQIIIQITSPILEFNIEFETT